MLDRHQDSAAPLTASGNTLQNTHRQQQQRSRDTDRRIRWDQADSRRRATHQQQRDYEHLAAAELIAIVARQERAQRPEQERQTDRCERNQLRASCPQRLKELMRKHERYSVRINKEVVPLNSGTHERCKRNARPVGTNSGIRHR